MIKSPGFESMSDEEGLEYTFQRTPVLQDNFSPYDFVIAFKYMGKRNPNAGYKLREQIVKSTRWWLTRLDAFYKMVAGTNRICETDEEAIFLPQGILMLQPMIQFTMRKQKD